MTPKIIASTYELTELIGSGGGGNVYLARHLRLNKKVVLKADKRKLSTRPELLRREVDVLKDLSHTYIPQVYDFFVEDDTVYTAMDYIEGESLDKPLKRGERFSQPQIIEWSRQLLEALSYLHSPTHGDPPRGFVHSDIKPANIMRTPTGNICLIDFNISLALGEENFVGYSAGYASPEHYGLDYSVGLGEKESTFNANAPTMYMSTKESSSFGKKTVVPDVRSDIFSMGAVMYHLLSGVRPASSALEVTPLSEKEFSPQLVRIITKAMQPNPDLRYQSADEMLDALNRLRENDPRTKRLKRGLAVAESCAAVLLAAGLFVSFTGLSRMQATEESLKLAEYSKTALLDGNRPLALDCAIKSIPNGGLFGASYTPQSEYALSQALGVYDLSDGFKAYNTVELGSQALCLRLSPAGKTFVAMCAGEAVVCDCKTAEVLYRLPAETSALSEAEYLSEDVIVFAARGGIAAYDIAKGAELWRGQTAVSITVSSDGGTVAAVGGDDKYAVIYDAKTGKEKCRADFGDRQQQALTNDKFVDPCNNLFELNSNGTLLAASFSDGTMSVFDLENPDNSADVFPEPTDYFHFEGGFYGKYLAFSAANSDGSAFAVIDCDEWEQTGGFQSESFYSVCADDKGILVQTDNILVKIDPESGEDLPLINTAENVRAYSSDGAHTMVSSDSAVMFFGEGGINLSRQEVREPQKYLSVRGEYAVYGSPNSDIIRIMRYENHPESEIFSYPIDYAHSEARVSADGQRLMLFDINAFRIYDKDGNVVCDTAVPDPQQIYDQQYIRNSGGSVLEVIYYSGKKLIYSGEDGSLLREESVEAPDSSLYEEFYTDTLRIESPLHGNPKVYSLDGERLVGELSENAYLTYVTQIGGNFIAQYTTADGMYYGVLMNGKCEELARLPYLCDVYDNQAVFDYPTGNIRAVRIYGSEELKNLALGGGSAET